MLLALVAACQPFGVVEPDAPVTDELTEMPPAKSTSPTPTPSSTSPDVKTPPIDFCAGATFCEDFEKSDRGNGLWDDFKAINGDTFERSAPSAGPGAFSLDAKIGAGSQTKHSSLHRDIGTFGHVEMTFAIRIPTTFGPNGHTNLAHLDFGSGPEFVALIVGEQSQMGLVIKDDDRDYQLVNKIEVAPNTWHEVKIVIDLPGDPPTAHMDIDGADVVKLDTLAVPFEGPPRFGFTLGPDYKTTQDPFEVRIDDLRIDARD